MKTAFLHGVLPEEETMYMEQPPGFAEPGREDWVWCLRKGIYGMKQASRIWNKTFHAAMVSFGFRRLDVEWCIYVRESTSGTILVAVHVDDIISAASSPDENQRFKDQLRSQWQISDLGEIKFALGIAVSRDLAACSISLSQTALIDRIVSTFGQSDAHPADTPMVAGSKLVRPDKSIPLSPDDADWVARTPFRSLIGHLMYVAIATRPDISFAVSRLASFLDCYRLEHWNAAVRVVRYLKGTRDMQLVLGGSNSLRLLGFSDSDYANDPQNSLSVMGYCFSLGSGVVSWCSRKQRNVGTSSCHSEYMALSDASREGIFLRQVLDGLRCSASGPTPLLCDNDAANKLSEDCVFHPRVKHIRVQYHYVRECVELGDLEVKRVCSADNTADIFTKPLPASTFTRLRGYLGLRLGSDG